MNGGDDAVSHNSRAHARDVAAEMEAEDRLAVVRERAIDLRQRCPTHVPRAPETGAPVGPSECRCAPERGYRITLIRRLMEDSYWLPDGEPYDVVLAEEYGLAAATIRNDASVARLHLAGNLDDPERRRQEQIDGANRTKDWALEAWAAGDRSTAAKLNEQALKVSGALAPPQQVVSVQIAQLFDAKTGELSEAGKAKARAEVQGVIHAIVEHAVARLPEAEREPERDAMWALAGATWREGQAKALPGGGR